MQLFFFATYAIQNDSKAIKGNAYLLKEELLDIYNTIVMIFNIRGYHLQN